MISVNEVKLETAKPQPATLTIVVPCYNEEAILRNSAEKLSVVLTDLRERQLIAESSQILFVDDGSKDSTWNIIHELACGHACFNGLKLSRNFGHQPALLAGLMSVTTDITISLDADLQDDISVIKDMVEAYYDGCDIVYGVRKSRGVDTVGKRVTAQLYYKLLRHMGVDILEDHADFRLMSYRSLRALESFHEVNLFLRGIVPLLGFRSRIVTYERKERLAGETKYSLPKMLGLALNGIVAFSSVPLRLIAWMGAFVSMAAVLFTIWAIAIKIFGVGTVPGWASTVVPIYFLGGVQLLSLGIIGAYLSRMYDETKARPRYIIADWAKGDPRDVR